LNTDETKRQVSVSGLGQINDKYPQMAKNFEEVKKQAYQPQTQRLGQTQGQPTQPQGKFFEQEKWQAEGQGQTS